MLDFAQRASGAWTIVERTSGHEFISQLDDDPPAEGDVAYLGRVPREDGRPFILIAGVHAIGSLGVARFLTAPDQLRELGHAIAKAPFSMVIGSSFDRYSLQIRSTEALTPPRRHVSAE